MAAGWYRGTLCFFARVLYHRNNALSRALTNFFDFFAHCQNFQKIRHNWQKWAMLFDKNLSYGNCHEKFIQKSSILNIYKRREMRYNDKASNDVCTAVTCCAEYQPYDTNACNRSFRRAFCFRHSQDSCLWVFFILILEILWFCYNFCKNHWKTTKTCAIILN